MEDLHVRFSRKSLTAILTAAGLAVAGTLAASQTVQAAPAPVTPPAITTNKLAKPAILPGSRDAKPMAAKGATKLVPVNPKTGAPLVQAGNNSSVDFSTKYDYCYGALTYPSVRNLTGATQYYEVVFYNGSQTRTFYSYLSAYSYGYPAFYGTYGSWSAYLYVWNGTSYAYDEYLSGNNTCSLSWSVTKSAYTGYLYFTIKNNGTAYAYSEVNELAPYPAYGTYTGDHWYYPAAGGGSASQYVYVGTGLKYGVVVNPAAGSLYYPSFYTGTL